jgi:hypothetical protein
MSQVSAEEVEKMRQEVLEDSELNLNFMILTITACLIGNIPFL